MSALTHPFAIRHPLLVRLAGICLLLLAVPCSASERETQAAAQAMQGISDDPAHQLYVCPMHPDQIAHAPGRCPQCGMFLTEATPHSTHPSMQAMQHQQESAPHQTADHQSDMSHSMSGDQKPERPRHYWQSAIEERMQSEQTHGATVVEEAPKALPRSKPETAADANTSQLPAIGTAQGQAQRQTTYVCPMHPQIVSSDPEASCPICGMDLVAKSAGVENSGNPQVYLKPETIHHIGLKTTSVQRGSIGKTLKTQGIVTPDDERIHRIHPRTGGWVERLYPTSEGERIERKEVLIDFYSPWINQTQLDFINALGELDNLSFDPSRKTELTAKVDSLRNDLRLLHVPPMDVMRIEKSRKVQNTIQLMAPQGGLITELSVTEGAYVEPYQSMFTIVDLSEVWVMVDIFEHQAPWIRKGLQVVITTPAIPGREWSGKLEFIYPEVNPKTRTLRARIDVPNPDEALLLNMFVQVDLSAGATQEHVLSVPREAVILTGERELVVKALGNGHFQPVEVTTGVWGNDQVEIIEGLDEGDEVVISGQFLIDSESNIQSSLLRMAE
jgi:Cu(I)/Ag(I) efflux system membrane fusion protein